MALQFCFTTVLRIRSNAHCAEVESPLNYVINRRQVRLGLTAIASTVSRKMGSTSTKSDLPYFPGTELRSSSCSMAERPVAGSEDRIDELGMG